MAAEVRATRKLAAATRCGISITAYGAAELTMHRGSIPEGTNTASSLKERTEGGHRDSWATGLRGAAGVGTRRWGWEAGSCSNPNTDSRIAHQLLRGGLTGERGVAE